jgi:hypothetical protein
MMIPYELKQKEACLVQAYQSLMEKLDEVIYLRAKNEIPFASLMGIKRQLFRSGKAIKGESSTCKEGERKVPGKEPEGPVKLLINELMNKIGVDVTDAYNASIVGEKEIKKALVMYDYYELAKEGIKYKEIKKKLSEKYGFSVSSIEKMVYGKR